MAEAALTAEVRVPLKKSLQTEKWEVKGAYGPCPECTRQCVCVRERETETETERQTDTGKRETQRIDPLGANSKSLCPQRTMGKEKVVKTQETQGSPNLWGERPTCLGPSGEHTPGRFSPARGGGGGGGGQPRWGGPEAQAAVQRGASRTPVPSPGFCRQWAHTGRVFNNILYNVLWL